MAIPKRCLVTILLKRTVYSAPRLRHSKITLYKIWTIPGHFFCFKQTLQFLQQINVKNVHPVYGAVIQTHDLWNVSLLP